MDKPETLLQKFFAFEDALMLEHVDGAIEITEQQYKDALVAKMAGRKAFVRDGELVIFSGVMVKAWSKLTKEPKEFDEFDVIPEDYTLIELVGDVVWDEFEWVERIKSSQELAQIEHLWVKKEMALSDLQIALHIDEDERAIYTIEIWKQYRRDLRNYTSSSDDGVITINFENRPVLNI